MASALWAMADCVLPYVAFSVAWVAAASLLMSGAQTGSLIESWREAFSLLTAAFAVPCFWLVAWILEKSRGAGPFADYGVTRAGIALPDHLVLGIVLFLFANAPLHAWILIADIQATGNEEASPLGLFFAWEGLSWTQLLFTVGLVLLTDPLGRGYLLTRLEDGFGTAGAVIFLPLILVLDPFSVWTTDLAVHLEFLCNVLAGALIGWSLLRSGSLLPGMVALALGSLPSGPLLAGLYLVGGAVAALHYQRAVRGEFYRGMRALKDLPWMVLGLGTGLLLVVRFLLVAPLHFGRVEYYENASTILTISLLVFVLVGTIVLRRFVPKR